MLGLPTVKRGILIRLGEREKDNTQQLYHQSRIYLALQHICKLRMRIFMPQTDSQDLVWREGPKHTRDLLAVILAE